MKKFNKPEIELISFGDADIIVTSGGCEQGKSNNYPGYNVCTSGASPSQN